MFWESYFFCLLYRTATACRSTSCHFRRIFPTILFHPSGIQHIPRSIRICRWNLPPRHTIEGDNRCFRNFIGLWISVSLTFEQDMTIFCNSQMRISIDYHDCRKSFFVFLLQQIWLRPWLEGNGSKGKSISVPTFQRISFVFRSIRMEWLSIANKVRTIPWSKNCFFRQQ